MKKTLIIIRREFLNRVSKKSFIILTVLMPFIMAALIFVPLLLSQIKDDNQKQVVVIDKTGEYMPLFKSDKYYAFVEDTDIRPEYKTSDSPVEAVVCITGNLVENPRAVTIYSHSEVKQELLSLVERTLNDAVRSQKLRAYNVPELDKIISDVQKEFSISTVKWDKEGGETSSNTGIAIAAGFIFTFLIYGFVMAYGGMVMSSVVEEKANRIVELMVSSVKPFQLMMGKIVGIALVGFAQLLIWGIMLTAILAVCGLVFGVNIMQGAEMNVAGAAAMQQPMPELSESQEIVTALVNLPYGELCLMFVLYFVGGYLLYASFFAAVGASVNEQEDSSQFMMPVVMLMVFGLYAAMYSIENTNGPLAFWASMFPLTSPIVMMIRIPFNVPLWEELLSLAILYGTAILFVWVSAKIYRVGILMYGKKPSIKEMIKWMRYQ